MAKPCVPPGGGICFQLVTQRLAEASGRAKPPAACRGQGEGGGALGRESILATTKNVACGGMHSAQAQKPIFSG